MFYLSPLPKCNRCKKPATYEIRGPRNEKYGNSCDRCKNIQITRLEKANAPKIDLMEALKNSLAKTGI